MTTDDEKRQQVADYIAQCDDTEASERFLAAHERALGDLREEGYLVSEIHDEVLIEPPPAKEDPEYPSVAPLSLTNSLHDAMKRRYVDVPAMGNVIRINPNHPSVASEPDRQLQPYDQDNDGSDGEPRPITRTYDDVGDFMRYLTVHEGHVGEGPRIGEGPPSPKVVRVVTHHPGPLSEFPIDDQGASGEPLALITTLSPAMATQFALAVLAAATKAGE